MFFFGGQVLTQAPDPALVAGLGKKNDKLTMTEDANQGRVDGLPPRERTAFKFHQFYIFIPIYLPFHLHPYTYPQANVAHAQTLVEKSGSTARCFCTGDRPS